MYIYFGGWLYWEPLRGVIFIKMVISWFVAQAFHIDSSQRLSFIS